MRDKRFIAAHRGGPLPLTHHRLLAAWAADCVEHLLPLLHPHPADDRLLHAIATARAWSRGQINTGIAQRAAVAAHAAARQSTDPVAIAIARAAGHAVATAHFADHALGPVIYGAKALTAASKSVDTEWAWQCAQLPAELRPLILSAIAQRAPHLHRSTPPARCCPDMTRHVEHVCEDHPNRSDCPDSLIHYSPKTGEYGILLRDGGTSYVVIRHCPWCGARLSGSGPSVAVDRSTSR